MLQYLTDQKIPELAMVKERIATVEKRAHIKAKEHLGGGALHTPLNTKTDSYDKYYGELNADGETHGRGICIFNNGSIIIGYFQDDDWSTGNYIYIASDGVFEVGEAYEKEGKKWERGTEYKTNGSEEQYDKEC